MPAFLYAILVGTGQDFKPTVRTRLLAAGKLWVRMEWQEEFLEGLKQERRRLRDLGYRVQKIGITNRCSCHSSCRRQMRTRIMNQVQAMNENQRWGKKLWSERR